MRDTEAEQEEKVEIRQPPRAPPVDQPEEEDRAEGQEDIGGVEPVAERAGIAASHLPGDLVAGPRLAHPARGRVDDRQRHLVVPGEPGDLPVAVDLVDAVGQPAVLTALLGDAGIVRGDRGGLLSRDPLFGCLGERRQEQRGERQERQRSLHRPKCSRTIGATSRRAHCSRSLASSGPQPTKRSGPSESPAWREPWLPPPA